MSLIKMGVASIFLLAVSFVQAEETFPNKNIHLFVPFSAGSQTDIFARWIGEKLFDSWGKQVIIDNRPSAGGVVASQFVLEANSDGHTMMMVSTGHAGNASLYAKLPYDTVRDFAGVTQIASVPNVLLVMPGLGVKTLKDFLTLAKSRSGNMNYSHAGIGSGTQINGEMLKLAAGFKATQIPYKGAPDALNNLIGGSVEFTFSPLIVAAGQLKAGRVLALGVSTISRSPLFPDIPTIAEAGLSGFDYDQWYGLLVAAKTPRRVVNAVNKEVVRILNLADIKERMLSQGAVSKASTPEAFDTFIRSEVKRFAPIIEAAGIRIN